MKVPSRRILSFPRKAKSAVVTNLLSLIRPLQEDWATPATYWCARVTTHPLPPPQAPSTLALPWKAWWKAFVHTPPPLLSEQRPRAPPPPNRCLLSPQSLSSGPCPRLPAASTATTGFYVRGRPSRHAVIARPAPDQRLSQVWSIPIHSISFPLFCLYGPECVKKVDNF